MSKRKPPSPDDKGRTPDDSGRVPPGESGAFELGRPQDPTFQQLASQAETAYVAMSGKLDASGKTKK